MPLGTVPSLCNFFAASRAGNPFGWAPILRDGSFLVGTSRLGNASASDEPAPWFIRPPTTLEIHFCTGHSTNRLPVVWRETL